MCDFCNVTSDGVGNILYFDWELRRKCLNGELKYNPDSHPDINAYFGFKGEQEDCRNKYEFNPLTDEFIINRINSFDDSKEVEKKVRALDFKTILPQLIIKPIVNPFKDIQKAEINPQIIALLKQWDSVIDYVSDSYDIDIDSMYCSVGKSVWNTVHYSVYDSVYQTVVVSVRKSICNSVYRSVDDSLDYFGCICGYLSVDAWVCDAVHNSFLAYVSSFFNLPKNQWRYCNFDFEGNPFQSCIDLWEMGIIPSFDGEMWRLHSGENADIIFTISQNRLRQNY